MSSNNGLGGVRGGRRGSRGLVGRYNQANAPAGASRPIMPVRGGVVVGGRGSVTPVQSIPVRTRADLEKELREESARKSASGSVADPDVMMEDDEVEIVEDPRFAGLRANPAFSELSDNDLKFMLRGRDDQEKKEREAAAAKAKAEEKEKADAAFLERLTAAPIQPSADRKRKADKVEEPSAVEKAEALLEERKRKIASHQKEDKRLEDVVKEKAEVLKATIRTRTAAIMAKDGLDEKTAKGHIDAEFKVEKAALNEELNTLLKKHKEYRADDKEKLEKAENDLAAAKAIAEKEAERKKEKEQADAAKKLRHREYSYFNHLRMWNSGVLDNLVRTRAVERQIAQNRLSDVNKEAFLAVARMCFGLRMKPEVAEKHAEEAWGKEGANFDLGTAVNLFSEEEKKGMPLMPPEIREARKARGFEGEGEDPVIMAEFIKEIVV